MTWRSGFFVLCALGVLAAGARHAGAHDLERTSVALTFARDGSFVLDVSNDPSWLKLRMEPFHGNFVDRIVLFVDGHEVRPTSVEFIPAETRATYRLRGRMPSDARTLRWYYGLVIDPYPLTIRRADGRLQVEEIAGDAWSRPIDLTGQFGAGKRAWTGALFVWIVIAGGVVGGVRRLLAARSTPRPD